MRSCKPKPFESPFMEDYGEDYENELKRRDERDKRRTRNGLIAATVFGMLGYGIMLMDDIPDMVKNYQYTRGIGAERVDISKKPASNGDIFGAALGMLVFPALFYAGLVDSDREKRKRGGRDYTEPGMF